VTTEPHIVLSGLAFGESPRWHDGRLWVADWVAQEILTVDAEGRGEVVLRVPFRSIPMCIDFLPDGRLLVVASNDRKLLRREADGSLVTHADLGGLAPRGWNEVVADGRGNAFLNAAGFDLMAGEEPKPGMVAVVTPDGAARQVADGFGFPNGMAVTPDGLTLLVADSYRSCIFAYDIETDGGLSGQRVWADLPGGAPDGICLDAEGAVWYASVPNNRCTRVREGGEVLQTVELDRGCFACALGGADGRTLYLVAQEWRGPAQMAEGPRTGQVLAVPAPAPAAARP
jgi:sugar lactone lactonase YvrE